MKTSHIVPLVLALLAASACSTPSATQDNELAASGPTVLEARVEPGTIELNNQMQPVKPAEVLADIKDFTSPVTEVKLQFTHVPLEVPMRNIGGTTWRAEFSPRQLQKLAVSGRTIRYDANVVATDGEGQTATSKSPVQLAIKAPDLARSS